MGTFEGHTYVGVPYLILGSWYVIQSLRRLHQCRVRGVKFESSMGFPADFFPGRFRNIPIDSILKVILVGQPDWPYIQIQANLLIELFH